MHIDIQSTAGIGKSVNIKREKASDDTERVVAHLKFSGLQVAREAIDELVGQDIGWAQSCLFDEGGAPIARMEIALPAFSAVVTGTVRGVKANEVITFAQAKLEGVALTLSKFGAQMSGELTWEVAGDEVADLEPLLGRECAVSWVVQDAGQGDLLKAA